MPRYLIERTFPNGLDVPASDAGASLRRAVTDTVFGVTWIHSCATTDGKRVYCIYDAPSPDAIRRAAECEQHSVTHLAEVRVLDPYFFK